jgi:hypothetical protein
MLYDDWRRSLVLNMDPLINIAADPFLVALEMIFKPILTKQP